MNILIVCESPKTLFLIRLLDTKEYRISLISKNRELGCMIEETYGIPVVIGDAACTAVLEQAAIDHFDLVLTLGENDAENLVICELAKKEYHVKKTVALVNNPDNITFFTQNGVDHCISEAELFASIVKKESISDGISKFLPTRDPAILVKEVVLGAKSKALNKKIWEIPFQKQSLAACIFRDGKAFIPHGNTECREGDRLIIIADQDTIEETITLFC